MKTSEELRNGSFNKNNKSGAYAYAPDLLLYANNNIFY